MTVHDHVDILDAVRRVAEKCSQRAHVFVGHDPSRPGYRPAVRSKHRTPRKDETLGSLAKDAVSRKARRALRRRTRPARRRINRARRGARRSLRIARATLRTTRRLVTLPFRATRGVFRILTSPARAASAVLAVPGTIVIVVLFCLLFDIATPGQLWGGAKKGGALIIPGGAACAPELEGGIVGAAHRAGAATKAASEWEPDAQDLQDTVNAVALKLGEAYGTFRNALDGEPAPTVEPTDELPPAQQVSGCCATAPGTIEAGYRPVSGPGPAGVTAEQAGHARTIIGVGTQRGIPAYGQVIALAAALQESGLRNLDYGDRDSLGLFQQRPSQGWGTAEQIRTPPHAARAFYSALAQVDGWARMSVTDAAQAVQRSGFPQAYADDEPLARRLMAELGDVGLQADAAAAADCGGDVLPADYKPGDHPNGQLPDSALAPIGGGHRLRPDAAASWLQLAEAYGQAMGARPSVTDSYRDLAGQRDCYARKGNMCAVPGTSNHGLGIAVDLGGGIQTFGTVQHQWMRANAGRFGWDLPEWARESGSKPEPWHWEYRGGTSA